MKKAITVGKGGGGEGLGSLYYAIFEKKLFVPIRFPTRKALCKYIVETLYISCFKLVDFNGQGETSHFIGGETIALGKTLTSATI